MAQDFFDRHADSIVDCVGTFDRVIFKGYLKGLSHPAGMMRFLASQGVLLKHFDRYVKGHTDSVVDRAKQWCAAAGRPYQYLNSYGIDKEDTARLVNDSYSSSMTSVRK